MRTLWTVLTTLVILSLALGTIACGAKEFTSGEPSVPTSVSGTEPSGGGTSSGGASGGTCCTRDVVRVAVKMPAGEEYDLGRWLGDSMTIPHVKAKHNDCPLKLDFYDYKADTSQDELLHKADYLFLGEITVDEQTGYVPLTCEQSFYGEDCQGGQIVGRFTFKMQLVDNHRGEVLKEGQTSWTGKMFEGAGERKPDKYEPYELGPIQTLSQSFGWLPEVIHKYEGLPEKATLEPEKDLEKDPVQAGEKVTIHLKDIVDYQGYKSQPWQWVVVKAEKGQIVGGREQDDGTHAFEVGKDGAIDLVYQAPDECKKDTDTITVWNSCNNDVRVVTKLWPEEVIATKSFDIDCRGWKLEATYTSDLTGKEGEETYSLKVSAILKPDPDQTDYSVGQLYFADNAYIQLQHIQSFHRASCGGQKWLEDQAHYDGNLTLHVYLWTIPPSVKQSDLGSLEDYWVGHCESQACRGWAGPLAPGTYFFSLDGFSYPLASKTESFYRDSMALPALEYTYSCSEWVYVPDPCAGYAIPHSGTAHVPAYWIGQWVSIYGLQEGYLPFNPLSHTMYLNHEDQLRYSGNEAVLAGDIEGEGFVGPISSSVSGSNPNFAPLETTYCTEPGFDRITNGMFYHLNWSITKLGE